MGPSGSGKTSLINCLAFRSTVAGKLTGNIYIDDKPLNNNFKYESGYVVQENILVSTLTIKENIMFSASLRLPSYLDNNYKKHLVDEVISELKLKKCANLKVGNALSRGVSGGQKRRCSIAMELVTNPSILFLDEPTSGLDASTAINVIKLLKRLSDKGCNVIMSIHQPRYGIFKLFTNLLLLSEGKIVYQGPSDQALNYFRHLGFICDLHNNPADFFLDVIEENVNQNIDPEQIEDDEEELDLSLNDDYELKNNPKLDLSMAYMQSEFYLELALKLKLMLSNTRINSPARSYSNNDTTRSQILENGVLELTTDSNKTRLVKKKKLAEGIIKRVANQFHKKSLYPTSFFNQFKVLTKRTIINYARNPQIIMWHAIIMLLYSLMLGWIYFRMDKSAKFGIQNRVGALYFILMNEVFISLSVIDIFILERSTFLYEVSNGFYRISMYFLSKVLGDLLIMKVISVFIVSLVAYWMIGLRAEISAYLTFIVTLFIVSSSSNSVAYFCSATFKNGTIANNLCSLLFVFMMVFGGFFVNIRSISPVIMWLKYCSIFLYANHAFLTNELKDQIFCDDLVMETNMNTSLTPDNNNHCITGNSYLINQGIPFKNDWDFWQNHVALVTITLIFWILSYIQLRRMKRN
ncbi:broad substrate specificity ATP-binding cassette transporter ABCG2-like [Gordionus sp. m RMFG-2023]|uniref:broad substrate specificity ATP-binding cassette transporter ABCG2-like n=1 Tax=Gordionus sp. m RMFG-2023 TaxID=3053472 RepID=UPI0031FDFE40